MNNLPVKPSDFIGAIAKTTQRLSNSAAGMNYMKLTKRGEWIYGVDDIDVEDGSEWAVNPNSLAVGYVAWPINGTGKPLGEEMRGITDDPIIESQLPDVGSNATWNQQVGMQLMCVAGEDVGTEAIFKTSSKGGINGFNDFLNVVMQHFQENPGTENVVPVIELVVDSYKHKDWGEISTPVFKLLKWVPIDQMPTEEMEGEDDEEEGEEEGEDEPPPPPPKAKTKAAKAKDEAKPRRRRRRAA